MNNEEIKKFLKETKTILKSSKGAKQLIKGLEHIGWVIKSMNSHIKASHKLVHNSIIMFPCTPSDHRYAENKISEIRRFIAA